MKTVFDFKDYKAFLDHALETSGGGRGSRSRLAESMGCQLSFLSQAIKGSVHLTLDHAAQAADFLKLSEDERHYFLLLVHHARAGSRRLRQYYESQMAAAQESRRRISERLKVTNPLDPETQARYYSAWYYAAIHVLLSVPGMQTKASIAGALGLPPALVGQALEFLACAGLAKRQGDGYRIGPTRLHLANQSPLIGKHHANWRLKAMQSLDREQPEDLHYSAVYTLSEEDAPRIRAVLLAALETAEPILRDSPAEKVYCLATDFFAL
jgi:uncharacterized protein (TIGR02147 family)